MSVKSIVKVTARASTNSLMHERMTDECSETIAVHERNVIVVGVTETQIEEPRIYTIIGAHEEVRKRDRVCVRVCSCVCVRR